MTTHETSRQCHPFPWIIPSILTLVHPPVLKLTVHRKASLQDQSKHKQRGILLFCSHKCPITNTSLFSTNYQDWTLTFLLPPSEETRTPSLIVCHPKAPAINWNLLHQVVLCFAIRTPFLEPTQCSYESVPSPKPTYQRCLIEMQTSNTIILQTNKTNPIAEKEQQKLDFQHPQPFMMPNCLIVWHFLSIIHFFRAFTFHPSINEKLLLFQCHKAFKKLKK